MIVETENLLSIFAKDVLNGLTSNPKRLSSKYFYDDIGSQIFQEIMEMPEYYLTDCELEILQEKSGEIFTSLGYQGRFDIIELGAGDGAKTKEFLAHLEQKGVEFDYVPIDISEKALELLVEDLQEYLPKTKIMPLAGDYFRVLQQYDRGEHPALFLFLGSNIGNYETAEAIHLLKMIHSHMRSGDHLLVGFDLKKNPYTVLRAYNDVQGITKRFNLNLLARINRELGANFNIDHFGFYPFYDPRNGEVRSHLFSKVRQTVCFEALDTDITFQKNELIYTELSKKYSPEEIEQLAGRAGFRHQQHFLDSRTFFSDSLWQKT